MSNLFSPLKIRSLEFKNRIFLSPMCQYSSEDGMPTDWHLVHLGARAVGGVSLIIMEATAVAPEGRITPYDTGIWSDRHAQAFSRISSFLKQQGCIPGIQLAHAGRKANVARPWDGGKPLPAGDQKSWKPFAPSPIAFETGHQIPQEMDHAMIEQIVSQFEKAAERSLNAGFQVAEIHIAHGYLLHEFLSPLSNQRKDEYGGSLENRIRLPLKIAQRIRKIWPDSLPVFVRISATDWVEGGWNIDESVSFAKCLKEIGIDLIDCSSAGLVPSAKIPAAPGFQTPFSAEIRQKVGIKTGTVGMITQPAQAEHIITTGQADAVLLGREMLRDPYWPLHAAKQLGVDIPWPSQYLRAK